MKERNMHSRLDRRAWLFIIPSLILIVAFVFYPMVQAFVTSFQTGVANNLQFGGIANYKRLLTDSTFKKALFNTVLFLIVQVPIMILLALAISSMLNNKRLKLRGMFRTAIFLPCVTSLVAYSIIFKSLFANDGFVNGVLMNLHLISEPINWLASTGFARLLIIMAITWRWTGYNMIFYLSGLQSIDDSVSMAEELEKEQKENNCFTSESWKAVQEALDAARTLMEDPEASQEAVDQTFLDLVTACNLLENGVQKTGLKAAIDGAEVILADAEALKEYTEESVEALREALKNAEAVFASDGADQGTVNNATNELLNAVTHLLVKEESNRLDILIQKAEELLENRELYTSTSVKALEEALEAAKKVAADDTAGEDAMNQAYNALAEAMTSLVRKAEKSELLTALNKANEILTNKDQYVEDSIANLQSVTDEAQAVYDKEEASASEVGEAVKALVEEILKARLRGDVDGNGSIDSADAAEVLQYAAELQELDEMQMKTADVNNDGAADSGDGTVILQYAAEMIEEF